MARHKVAAEMFERKAVSLAALAFVALALPATALALRLRAAAHAVPATAARVPASNTSPGVPEIGTLYANASAAQHRCTAAVVHSPRGNTLVTAGHCISGRGAGMVFVPGQRGSVAPYGRWTVTATHVEPKWVRRQDPEGDVAFLTVAPQTIRGVATEIERVTGGYRLGSTAVRGQRVTVTGYPSVATNPITCTTTIYLTASFPSFDCRGYVSGTSGAPWLRTTRRGPEIVGVLGGLNQGGCHDYTSFSSPLARDADSAYLRAAENAQGDIAPPPGDDGC
ncbi:MAG: trypsin-like serine peptidase [Solirubrobacteraceae bacterium]